MHIEKILPLYVSKKEEELKLNASYPALVIFDNFGRLIFFVTIRWALLKFLDLLYFLGCTL